MAKERRFFSSVVFAIYPYAKPYDSYVFLKGKKGIVGIEKIAILFLNVVGLFLFLFLYLFCIIVQVLLLI